MNATCFHDVRSELAEGPVWHRDQLWWVDIERGELHATDPASGSDRLWRFSHRLGFVVPTRQGDFLLGTDRGIARFSQERPELVFVAHPEPDRPGNRFNDAKCDPAGRLWAGTMAIDETLLQGSLYRLDHDLEITRTVQDVSISNGLAWSPDGRTMYYVDSPTRRIDAFDFDPVTGSISSRRTIAELKDGFPDGMSADHNGNLWVAVWGGSCVACYDPKSGERLAEIQVPAEFVTSCCFGPDDSLFITTAGRDVTPEMRREQLRSGSLFRAQVGVGGPTPPLFGG